ncbi:YggS family pyridoxal phosphate-dependent enzyme [Endozoicomonas sp. G2_1]|uniref:YggS family pyridoxal phosphate-dependent enzyme n=1 Tax=Endozoicomonas sp. G2_1 TaxID=2821091 RepID=UPI001AD99631|nr:YggS family pyridoxal phosphate-dependent enzyme [Endozoicomonas sp. G2_1]MBO9489136.1 YggS family pyridoxal phosphate-dependent enzyme [Endozoicomonas sp. G2_1]
MTSIKHNLMTVKQQIEQACQQAHRPVEQVSLLAVSKKKPAEQIAQAHSAGQKQFGESYVQEAVEKVTQLQHLTDIEWHFIGPIQSNKTKAIAENFAWVHSVDRAKIAERLNEQRGNQDTPLQVCLQVNISGEASKSGATVEQLPELLALVDNSEHLVLRGLMAIPEKNSSAQSFEQMQALFLQYQAQYPTLDTLSMGMSGDMTAAINSGSTMVRVGTAIFGSREA